MLRTSPHGARSQTPELGWLRPALLAEPHVMDRVQRHAREQKEEFVPLVQILDVLVPQMVDQLVDVLKIIDISLPVFAEQEIEVPKINL